MLLKYSKLVFNYAFFEALQKIISFCMIPIFINKLGASEYGSFVIFSYWVGLISVLISCGLTNGVSQYIYDSDNLDIGSLIWSPVIQISTFFILSCILILFAHKWVGFFAGIFTKDSIALLLLMTSIYFTSMNSYLRSCFIYLEKTKVVNISILITLIVTNLLAAIFILINNESIVYYAIAVLISMLFSVIYLVICMMKFFRFKYDRVVLLSVNKFSFPLFVASFVMLFFETVDKYTLQANYSKEDNSIYNIAFQFASIAGIAVSGFLSVWPGMYHKNKKYIIEFDFFSRITFLYMACSLVLMIFVIVFSTYSIKLFFPAIFLKSVDCIIPLTGAIVLQRLYSIILMKILTSGLTHVKLILEILFTCVSYYTFLYHLNDVSLFQLSLIKYLFYIFLLMSAMISLRLKNLIDVKLMYVFIISISTLSSIVFLLYYLLDNVKL
jgi:O-antigen/teichoic acid export membrane protein